MEKDNKPEESKTVEKDYKSNFTWVVSTEQESRRQMMECANQLVYFMIIKSGCYKDAPGEISLSQMETDAYNSALKFMETEFKKGVSPTTSCMTNSSEESKITSQPK